MNRISDTETYQKNLSDETSAFKEKYPGNLRYRVWQLIGCPGGMENYNYMSWITKMWTKFYMETYGTVPEVDTEKNHALFDNWLVQLFNN